MHRVTHMEGRIHSVESFGTVDGPGVRLVIFLQGCPLRCQYCHNPDTWDTTGGTLMSPGELIARYEKNRPFYRRGGITVTGGEPLLQVDFLIELFSEAKARGIHTCIDTSGATYRPGDTPYNIKLATLMTLTDLVLLDIKHTDPVTHKDLTGMANDGITAFARYLDERNIPVWIRHVLVPGLTDGEAHLARLGRFMATLQNVQALDVLPYHTMGEVKYQQLGIPYPLEGVEAATADAAVAAKKIILGAYVEAKKGG